MGLREKAIDYLQKEKTQQTPDLALTPDKKNTDVASEHDKWDENILENIKEEGKIDKESLLNKYVPDDRSFLLEGDFDGTIPTASEFAYQNRIEALLNLFEIIKELGFIEDEDELWNTLLFSLTGQLGIKKSAVFLKDKDILTHRASKGFIIEDNFKLPRRSGIERILKKDISIHYAKTMISGLAGDEKTWLNSLDAEILIPILRYEDIVGFIILGRPLTGKDFNLDDLLYVKLLGEVLGSLYESINRIVYVNRQAKLWNERELKHKNLIEFLNLLEIENDEKVIESKFLELLENNYAVSLYIFLAKEKDNFIPIFHKGLKDKTIEKFNIPLTESWIIESRNQKQWYNYVDFKDNHLLDERFSSEDKKIIQSMYVLPMFFNGQLDALFLLFEVKKPLDNDDLSNLQMILNTFYWQVQSKALYNKYQSQINDLRQDPLYPLRTLFEEKEKAWTNKYIPYSALLLKIANIDRLKNTQGEKKELEYRGSVKQILEKNISTEDFLAEIFPSQYLLMLKGKKRSDTWQMSKLIQREINKIYPKEELRPILNYRIIDRPETPLPKIEDFLID
ncbi:MAG: hypothetical protein OEZ22_08330 [Spirochaetia bacterium]|nr:hypothetical protein [Spirochaetia bacterium]